MMRHGPYAAGDALRMGHDCMPMLNAGLNAGLGPTASTGHLRANAL